MASGSDSDLARLIAMEQQLGLQLEEARRQAEELRARARAEARAREQAQELELAALLETRATRAREQLRGETAGLVRAGETAARRFTALGEEEADRLARRVLRRIHQVVAGEA